MGLDLHPGERVLAYAPLRDGRWVVGTTRALHVMDRAGQGSRRAWDQVNTAVWSESASMLEITWADRAAPLQLEVAGDGGFLPEVIRERVEASVVVSSRIDVGGRRSVRVAVRRVAPGAELTTQVVADRGVDLTDPDLVARVALELADLREQVGMRDAQERPELPRLDSNQRPSD